MDKVKKLKAENAKRNISEIVAEIHDEVNRSRKAVIRKVELLYYLELTSRFREIEEYKKSLFFTFLSYEFNLRPGTYHKERRAVFGFRKHCERYGVGYVAKVIGGTKFPEKVFKEINGLDRKSKKPLQRQKLEEVFEKHKKPEVPKVVIPRVCSSCEGYRQEIRLLSKETDELKEQVKKLKAALRKRDAAIEQMTGLMKPFVPAEAAAVQ